VERLRRLGQPAGFTQTRIKQLKQEIVKIDGDVKTAVNTLVREEAAYNKMKEDVEALKTVQEQRRKDLLALVELVEKNATEPVAFKNQTYTPDEAQSQLDFQRVRYESGKKSLKAQEQLLKTKHTRLKVADQRIFAIQEKKTALTNLVAELEAKLELLRLKQLENTAIEVDDTQVKKCQELYENLSQKLREEEIRGEKYLRYGLIEKEAPASKDDRSRIESINAVRAALSDDDAKAAKVEPVRKGSAKVALDD